MRMRLMLAALLAALTAGALLGACGSDSGDATETTGAAGADADVQDDQADTEGETGADQNSEPDSSAKSAKVDACDLFEHADAEKAVGAITLVLSPMATPAACQYSASDSSIVAQVTVQYLENGLVGVDAGGVARAMGGDGDPKPVPSIDGALSLDIVGLETIIIPDGESFATVSATGQGGPGAVVALAEVVAGNL